MQQEPNSIHPVILFDGYCNLCSGVVQFVIKRDPKKHFRFASLQSKFGQSLLTQKNLSITDPNSFLLLQNGIVFSRSTGALKVAKSLSGIWPMLYGSIILPVSLRDALYDFIAGNRYRWFGKKEVCWIPNDQFKDLFIA
ncbi:MAG: DCC1-like thiol-disulfide oxidoreductase family protein [Chitinophagaceae bacterium]|nr:DCC1-like thiol-disulfide oxidoreductase family protein [Chitinophagaceae bacterium]